MDTIKIEAMRDDDERFQIMKMMDPGKSEIEVSHKK
jgi:hypothetical protein